MTEFFSDLSQLSMAYVRNVSHESMLFSWANLFYPVQACIFQHVGVCTMLYFLKVHICFWSWVIAKTLNSLNWLCFHSDLSQAFCVFFYENLLSLSAKIWTQFLTARLKLVNNHLILLTICQIVLGIYVKTATRANKQHYLSRNHRVCQQKACFTNNVFFQWAVIPSISPLMGLTLFPHKNQSHK